MDALGGLLRPAVRPHCGRAGISLEGDLELAVRVPVDELRELPEVVRAVLDAVGLALLVLHRRTVHVERNARNRLLRDDERGSAGRPDERDQTRGGESQVADGAHGSVLQLRSKEFKGLLQSLAIL